MKKNRFSLKIDGRFYYGWVMLLCAFMPMFICYVIKVNCAPLFMTPITEELGISRTAYTQTNSIMTVTMMLCSLVIGKIYKKIPVKFALTGCVALTSVCYVLMSFSTSLWQLYVLSAIQGLGWAGATTLPTTIIVSNWFGPKVKGTALSIAMLGSGAGALVWINLITAIIASSGWRVGYLAMAGFNALIIPIALIFIVSMPSDKGFETRVGDPTPSESTGSKVSSQKAGITGKQALTTSRWWLQFAAGLVTMIGASAFSYNCKDYFTGLTGSDATAAAIYSGALGTLILGKFLLGIFSDVLHIKRTSVIAPLFYAGVFVCLALSGSNMVFASVMVPLYMIGGAVPSVIPFLITARNFGDKEYGVMSGWMNIAGNIGQIIGPTVAAFIFDFTGTYLLAWIIFAILMVLVALLYLFSNNSSKKQIEAMGYKPE